jgi:hypothetical protein
VDFSTLLLVKGCSIYAWREFEAIPATKRFCVRATVLETVYLEPNMVDCGSFVFDIEAIRGCHRTHRFLFFALL